VLFYAVFSPAVATVLTLLTALAAGAVGAVGVFRVQERWRPAAPPQAGAAPPAPVAMPAPVAVPAAAPHEEGPEQEPPPQLVGASANGTPPAGRRPPRRK
jgi:hypothetical protein